MGRARRSAAAALCAVLSMALFACAAPEHLGVSDGRLAPCPGTPNCVSSDAEDGDHHIAPLRLVRVDADVWRRVQEAVAALPRTTLVRVSDDYLHAECRSAVFRFVDDLELHLRADQGLIAVRSAARLGRRDFGVNRERVQTLRASLARSGVVLIGDAN